MELLSDFLPELRQLKNQILQADETDDKLDMQIALFFVKTTVDKIDYYERQHDFSVPTEEQVFSDEVYEFYRTAKANGFKTSDERIQAENDRMEQEACRLLDIKKNLDDDFIDAIAELQAKGVDYASVIKSIADVGNWNLICSECLKEFVGRFVDNYKSGPALIPEADEEPDA